MPAFRLRIATVLIAVSAVSIGAACEGDRTHFEKVFDPCAPLVLAVEGGSAEQRASIEDTIAMWNAVASVSVTTEDVPLARQLPIRFEDTELYMGYFDDIEGVIYLSHDVPAGRPLSVVLAHELGHAFNLYHVGPDQRVSVMNKGNFDLAPTEDDAAHLAYKWGACVARAD